MITSKDGLNLIKSFEGCRLTSYQDSGGVWTIGYGHTNGVKPNHTISQEQATLYLQQDLKNAEKYVNAYVSVYNLTQHQFDALVSFTYNCGGNNLAKRLLNYGKKPLALVKVDMHETCIKAKGKTLPGLIRRREAEAKMMGDCKEPISIVVDQVLNGYWGNGIDRKRKLEEAGYDVNAVQQAVNDAVKARRDKND